MQIVIASKSMHHFLLNLIFTYRALLFIRMVANGAFYISVKFENIPFNMKIRIP